ncbi:MAG: hypothetical protein JSR61_19910 [Proteobacteria bacterium]|nr:hypothetical protein [Pseudomonadota bacterium]
MPSDFYEPSKHLSDYYRDHERLRQQRDEEARRAAELHRQHRERFNALAAKLLDRVDGLLDRMPSAQQQQPAAPDDDLSLVAARRQLAHIVRAPQMCSRKLCRRTRACCGEPKQCLAVYLPLLPPAKVAELLLDGRKTRRRRARAV